MGKWMYRVHIHYLLPHTTQSDGIQLTLGTDLLDLWGTRPHYCRILAFCLNNTFTYNQDVSARYAPKRH